MVAGVKMKIRDVKGLTQNIENLKNKKEGAEKNNAIVTPLKKPHRYGDDFKGPVFYDGLSPEANEVNLHFEKDLTHE